MNKSVFSRVCNILLSAGMLMAMLFNVSMAEETTPDVMVKNVTNEVLEIIRKDKENQDGNTKN